MSNSVPGVPAGYHSVTSYLLVEDAAAQIEFLKAAFRAAERSRQTLPDGSIGNTEMQIGDSVVMLSQSRGEWKAMPCMVYVYLEDVDAVYARALSAGATTIQAPADMPYGDRAGGVLDSNGNQWWIATRMLPRAE